MAKIHCSNCGKLVNETANYCWDCGAALHGSAAALYQARAPMVVNPSTASAIGGEIMEAYFDLADETVPLRHLDPAAKFLFFLNYLGKTAILFPAFLVGIYYQPLVAGGLFLYLFVTYLIAVLVYNHFIFSVNKNNVNLEYGIIHKRHVSIPYAQIQNVNITRTFIDRMLGIARIEIESAGSASARKRDIVGGTRSKAEAYLPGLNLKDAQKLHDLILQKVMRGDKDHSSPPARHHFDTAAPAA